MTTPARTTVDIADDNLRLALLDQVQEEYDWVETLADDYEAARSRHPDWPGWSEVEDNEDEENPALAEFLLTLELSAEMLGQITRLTLDGDRSVYEWLGGEMWHEDDDLFVIRDLAGLEHCSAVEYLVLGQGIVEGASLLPLAQLSRLQELRVCALTGLTDIDVVLQLPALATLSVVNIASSKDQASWQRVIDAFDAAKSA
jgi:hypothetical protein